MVWVIAQEEEGSKENLVEHTEVWPKIKFCKGYKCKKIVVSKLWLRSIGLKSWMCDIMLKAMEAIVM